jgi:hypothetical protein
MYKRTKVITKIKTWLTDIALVLGLLVLLFISNVFDQRMNSMLHQTTLRVSPWVFPVAILLIGTVIFLLFWFMQNRLPKRIWVAIIYLVIGLFIAFAWNLSSVEIFQAIIPRYLPKSVVPTKVLLNTIFDPRSYLYIAGSLAGIAGLLLLILPGNKKNQ